MKWLKEIPIYIIRKMPSLMAKKKKLLKQAKKGARLFRKYLNMIPRPRKGKRISSIGMTDLDPFPQRKFAKMVMVQNLLMPAPATNLAYEYIYRVNSTFAPDLTGATGRQPYGRDTLAVLYSYYTVHYVTAIVEFYDSDQDGVMVGYQIQGDSISGLQIGEIDERPWAKCTSMSNSGEQKKKYVIKIPMHTALGITNDQYNNDTSQYSAAYNANPTQGVFLRLFAVSTQAGVVSNVKFKIKLIQDSIWYTRTSLPQS